MKAAQPDPATSARMAAIRQKSTLIECRVATELREHNIRYRKNVKQLAGSPDFANRSRGWAIFVNGCFWHHHTGCKYASVPKTNIEFWTTKFCDNRRRDARAITRLRRKGYTVAIVWGCQTGCICAKLGKIFEASSIDHR